MRRLEFEVLGKPWTIRLLKKKKYRQKNGSDSVGVTRPDKRRIDLGPDGLGLETICHELTHAFLAEMCMHEAEFTAESLEEIFAELMAKRGREILDLADSLHQQIQI